MILELVDSLQNEALAPVGHTMRYLAQGYNDLSFRRRDAVVAGIRDPILQQQIKATPLGMSTFFKEDVSRDIDTSAQRHQQNVLTAAIRHRSAATATRNTHQARSRSPVRCDRDQLQPRRRPFGRGSSSGGGASWGGRGASSGRARRY